MVRILFFSGSLTCFIHKEGVDASLCPFLSFHSSAHNTNLLRDLKDFFHSEGEKHNAEIKTAMQQQYKRTHILQSW